MKTFPEIRNALSFGGSERLDQMLALTEEQMREYLAHFRDEPHYAELAPVIEQHLKIRETKRAEEAAGHSRTQTATGQENLCLSRKIYWLAWASLLVGLIGILIALLKQ